VPITLCWRLQDVVKFSNHRLVDLARSNAVLGFILAGASAVLIFHLHRKLQEAGERNLKQLITIPSAALWTLPRAYLEARSRHGWSAWPAYAVWACVVSGSALLLASVARFGR